MCIWLSWFSKEQGNVYQSFWVQVLFDWWFALLTNFYIIGCRISLIRHHQRGIIIRQVMICSNVSIILFFSMDWVRSPTLPWPQTTLHWSAQNMNVLTSCTVPVFQSGVWKWEENVLLLLNLFCTSVWQRNWMSGNISKIMRIQNF